MKNSSTLTHTQLLRIHICLLFAEAYTKSKLFDLNEGGSLLSSSSSTSSLPTLSSSPSSTFPYSSSFPSFLSLNSFTDSDWNIVGPSCVERPALLTISAPSNFNYLTMFNSVNTNNNKSPFTSPNTTPNTTPKRRNHTLSRNLSSLDNNNISLKQKKLIPYSSNVVSIQKSISSSTLVVDESPLLSAPLSFNLLLINILFNYVFFYY
jgi:hypothetical protein